MSPPLSPALASFVPVDEARSFALADLSAGARARIVGVEVPHDDVHWLAAVGIGAGETVTLLRRAMFGGPLHVRTGAGGEFAVDRGLAAGIRVVMAPAP